MHVGKVIWKPFAQDEEKFTTLKCNKLLFSREISTEMNRYEMYLELLTTLKCLALYMGNTLTKICEFFKGSQWW